MHTNLLRQKSEAFRAALSNKWNKKGYELRWEYEDPDVVESVIDWIYHGSLPKLTATQLDFDFCLLCYKFAETRMMYSLKNTIVDLLRNNYVQRRSSTPLRSRNRPHPPHAEVSKIKLPLPNRNLHGASSSTVS